MPFQPPSLDQMWVDFLLIFGFALTGGSLIALGLCVLGGCLELLERRRDRRVRSRNPGLAQAIVLSDGIRIAPDSFCIKSRKLSAKGAKYESQGQA